MNNDILLRDILPKQLGVFSFMPNDIWGSELDNFYLDTQIYTRCYYFYASNFVKMLYMDSGGNLDITGLSEFIYNKYKRDFEQLHNAIYADYDPLLTGFNSVERTYNRDLQTFNTDNEGQIIDKVVQNESKGNDVLSMSGSEIDKQNYTNTKNLTDTTKMNDSDKISKSSNNKTVQDGTNAGKEIESKSNKGAGSGSSLVLGSRNETITSDENKSQEIGSMSESESKTGTQNGTIKTTGTDKITDSKTRSFSGRKDTRALNSQDNGIENTEVERTAQNEGFENETITESRTEQGASIAFTTQEVLEAELKFRENQKNFYNLIMDTIVNEIASYKVEQ